MNRLHRAIRLHRDEGGSLSIVSVFALMLLVVLLGMVMNSARRVDQKVKIQNAADSATYAGGLVIARSMNTLAFTNHLLSDVFAITAFLREARDRNAESLTPEILDNWDRVAPAFIGSEFPPFDQLGLAIEEKVPYEREMVRAFGEWSYAASELMLPVFEEILAQEMIPRFQRELVVHTPRLAQDAVDEVARRHGAAWPRTVELRGVLWNTLAAPVGETEAERRTLQVVDPLLDQLPNQAQYMFKARQQRDRLARRYLDDWNNELLEVFDEYGKMSQYSHLWRIFTCAYLTQLLEEEYPNWNLPYQIRTELADVPDSTWHMEDYFTFVGVVYHDKLPDRIPGVFQNPVESDDQAYAQAMVFVPRNRLVWTWNRPVFDADTTGGGVPGQSGGIFTPGADTPAPQPIDSIPRVIRQGYTQNWDLINQHWTTQLVPATFVGLPDILSTQPAVGQAPPLDLPDFSQLSYEDFRWISHH